MRSAWIHVKPFSAVLVSNPSDKYKLPVAYIDILYIPIPVPKAYQFIKQTNVHLNTKETKTLQTKSAGFRETMHAMTQLQNQIRHFLSGIIPKSRELSVLNICLHNVNIMEGIGEGSSSWTDVTIFKRNFFQLRR